MPKPNYYYARFSVSTYCLNLCILFTRSKKSERKFELCVKIFINYKYTKNLFNGNIKKHLYRFYKFSWKSSRFVKKDLLMYLHTYISKLRKITAFRQQFLPPLGTKDYSFLT